MKARGQFQSFRVAGLTASALVIAMLGAGQANAQVDPTIGAADPGQAANRLSQPEISAPAVEPNISVNQAKPIGAPAGAEKITFTLNGLEFEGVSVYNEAQLRSVYAGKVGQTVSLADVYSIANALTLKYRNDGYILTQVVVPPQEISGGTPKLRVVEGYINDVQIQKADAAATIDMANIQSYARQINSKGPLNVKDLERQLLIINDLPGVTARSILSPSPSTPGAADMLIIVDYDPIDGIISADNFGSRYLGPTQVGAAATLNSVLGMNEAISGQVVVAPEDWYELAYGALGYEQPVGTLGTKMHVNGSITDTDPGWDLQEFDVRGRSYLFNVGATHPFIRSRTENLTGRLNFDWRRVKSSNNIEETRRDRISALRLGGRFEFVDNIFSAAANTIDLEASKGLNIFGASDEGDDNLTRSEADPQFTKLEMEVQRLQRLTDSVNLLVAGRGQIASNALLSSEEFSVGGVYGYGRAYDPSEVTGDHGIAGKVELQWREPVRIQSNFLDSYQLYGFYDIGKVWNEDATTSDQKSDSLASVGAGIRFDLPYDVDGGVAVAFPLTREPQTRNDHDPRFYFNLSKRF